MKASRSLIEAIAVTVELTGTELSEAAAKVFANDLAQYPEDQVIAALTRCRREVRHQLTIADVLTRLDDGRPTDAEAWAQLPFSESQTVVWTQEMAEAFGVALPLVEAGDKIAGRLAFRDAYNKAVQRNRDAGVPAQWTVSLGQDKAGREGPIREAIERGRLKNESALPILGYETGRVGSDKVANLLPQLDGPEAA